LSLVLAALQRVARHELREQKQSVTSAQRGRRGKNKNGWLASPHAIGSVLQVAQAPFARPTRPLGVPMAEIASVCLKTTRHFL
jgi:hypothetical protein